MKKISGLLLALCMLLALGACGTGELYIHDTPETEAPEVTVAAVPAEPQPEPKPDYSAILGQPLMINVAGKVETFAAPDGSGRTILTYGCDEASVFMNGNAEAAKKINRFLARQDEVYYSGSGEGDGVNAMLEQATDNFSYAVETGAAVNLEYSSMRSVFIERGDRRVLSLRYRVNSYTGGAHGLYADKAYVFDLDSGELLTLADLSDDLDTLKDHVLRTMMDTVQNDIRYQPLMDYMKQFTETEPEAALSALLREGSWLLTENGLAVFSDIYEIGSYADGIVRFTVPYEELDGLLKEQWMPVERPEGGELRITGLNSEESAKIELLDKVVVSGDGEDFRVYALGTVYDVSLDSVTYISDDVGFYLKDTHWYCSYLSDNGIQIQAELPEGMPDLMISYTDASGETHRCLLTADGANGSAILVEEDQVVAVG